MIPEDGAQPQRNNLRRSRYHDRGDAMRYIPRGARLARAMTRNANSHCGTGGTATTLSSASSLRIAVKAQGLLPRAQDVGAILAEGPRQATQKGKGG